jgi:HEAT repeat protein
MNRKQRAGGLRFSMSQAGKWMTVVAFAAGLAGCRKPAKEPLAPMEDLAKSAHSQDDGERWTGIRDLGKRAPKHTEAVPLLIEALSDKDENVRYMASEGLSKFGAAAAEAVPKLAELLHDPVPTVRTGAAAALKNMGAAALPALPDLYVAARDGDPEVRGEANQAITTINQAKKFQDMNAQPAR